MTGKGLLTNINTLQNYYGMAIRQNASDVYGMKKGVGAVLYHCTDVKDEEERHQFVCEIKRGGANGGVKD